MRPLHILSLMLINCFPLFAQTDSTKTKIDSTVTPAPSPSQTSPRRDQRPLTERIALGFGSSFWINTKTTYIEVAPVIAYLFPKALVTGVGYRYIYRHDRLYGY